MEYKEIIKYLRKAPKQLVVVTEKSWNYLSDCIFNKDSTISKSQLESSLKSFNPKDKDVKHFAKELISNLYENRSRN